MFNDDLPDAITHIGYSLWYLKPERTPIDLEDIRYALGNICRYNGHLEWNLLRHLALCTLLAQHNTYNRFLALVEQDGAENAFEKTSEHLELVAQCACHDIHEIYVGDITSGLKKHLPDFQRIELLWETYVLKTLGLDLPTGKVKAFVKEIDLKALALEMTILNHPGAKYVYVPVDEEEMRIFDLVQNTSPSACWLIIIEAIEQYQNGVKNGENRVGESNGS